MRDILIASLMALGIASNMLFAREPAISTETGKIVSRLNRTLAIVNQEENSPRKFDVPVEAKIILDGQPVKLERLQMGDYVVLSFSADKKLITVDAKSGMLKLTSAVVAD